MLISTRAIVSVTVIGLAALISAVQADSNDWVNVDYVIQQSQPSLNSRQSTTDAQTTIIHSADRSTREGPWSVTNAKVATPPSGDLHDYMSWAPYHWPNCNYCSGTNRNHLAHPTHPGEGSHDNSSNTGNFTGGGHPDAVDHEWEEDLQDQSANDQQKTSHSSTHLRRMLRLRRTPLAIQTIPAAPSSSSSSDYEAAIEDFIPLPQVPIGGLPPLPTEVDLSSSPSNSASQTSIMVAKSTPGPAQAAAKASKPSCIPSPTDDAAPSATWTTCPYVTRDGQVNPDVRTLNGPGAINSASQAIINNAVAYALQKSPGHSKNAARFIDTFFLDSQTQMNPNMKYGQIVRGPGPEGLSGTFTGVLDLRGIVKVVNAVLLLRASKSPDWTSARDQGMSEWMSLYSNWLTSSPLGRTTASRPNNHGSFYASQAAAAKMLAGDDVAAAKILQVYFATQFIDQVAKSGEQPFEAVRTRPYHYRCFNLEAMITNAKLGDQLGLNLWAVKSKYGATIQTATDFIMAADPKNEDVSELVPHVAAVAAAYGDPTGKYGAFLKKTMQDYQAKSFWFYDQAPAIPNSPAAAANKRARDDTTLQATDIPFECPKIFELDNILKVEIDNGVFVTCEELRPFYETPSPVST